METSLIYSFSYNFEEEATENVVQNSPSVMKIPIRATIISAMSVVPYAIILFAIFLSNQSTENVGAANRLVTILLCALRCPTIGLFTYKVHTEVLFLAHYFGQGNLYTGGSCAVFNQLLNKLF